MGHATGENEQALRKILDMTRWIAISFLCLHFYQVCYPSFISWGDTNAWSDRFMRSIAATGLFTSFHQAKLFAFVFLMISLLGVKGRKDLKVTLKKALAYFILGLIAYFLSVFCWLLPASFNLKSLLYMGITGMGMLALITGGTWCTRIVKHRLQDDIFNHDQETFPQEERKLENEYSINLPARYRLKQKWRTSWINIINPFRGLLVMGTPGSGKSYFVIRHVITQHLQKGFSMFVYDFKLPDLSIIVYNHWLKYRHLFRVQPEFYVINFDDLNGSHRCNPLDAASMLDITDAAESARTILLGLNRDWIKKQGDFFVESAINFVTAIIWFLKKYEGGKYCSLPHVIELMQVDYPELFALLQSEKEIEVLINPFVNAFKNEAMEQLEGQIASAKIAMARLASPQLYYVLSGNDFTLDINDPEHPKVVCMGNNPQKIQIYGAVLSLYVNRLIKLVNQKNRLKCSLIFDEFPTIYLNGMDSLIATARSNRVSTTLGIQDISQLKKDYGREQAEVIMGIIGNIVSGQVTGDSAKQLSERIGKIMQDRQSLSINSGDTSISQSKQLEAAVPPSKIAALSAGEFVGMVADDPQNKIGLKAFHNEIVNDHQHIAKEIAAFHKLPVIRKVDQQLVYETYYKVKKEIENMSG